VAYLAGLILVQTGVFGLLAFWLVRAGALSGRGLTRALLPAAVAAATGFAGAHYSFLALNIPLAGFGAAMSWGILFAVVHLGVLRFFYRGELEELVAYFPGHDRLQKILVLKK
jgi:hypothetical protein